MVIYLMENIHRKIIINENNYIEVDSHIGEDISFEFDGNGNLVDMY